MAFLKHAHAKVVRPAITATGWDEVRAKALALGSAFDKKASAQVVLQKFRPDKYLLSHCTIIASVDTEPSGLPLGRQLVDGFQIDRAYPDYLVTAATTQYINNNHDAWERKLLLGCFRTFIGGENYVEHIQIPEMSRGKIIDAAARDIGDSVYVDILVATDLRHRPLVAAVSSGELSTLSMGCQVSFTLCTKCGNRAEDETQLCPHIRYMKGNQYIDGLGRTRRIAELCGHISEEPGSVKFIEASWVANPAFPGAVLRNILTPQEKATLGNRIQVAFTQGPRVADPSKMSRAARGPVAQQSQGEQEPFNFDEAPAEPAKDSPDDAYGKLVDELAGVLREKALTKVRDEMTGGDKPRADLDEDQNDTFVREAIQKSAAWRTVAKHVLARHPEPETAKRLLFGLMTYRSAGWKGVQGKFTGQEILAISRFADRFAGVAKMAGEDRIYRTVSEVGGMAVYADSESYLSACRRIIGRDLTHSEKDALIAKGRLFDLGS